MQIDEKTFNTIYDQYFTDICCYLNYYIQDSYIIEEVVQEVFVKLWEDCYMHDIKYLKTYLYSSARNKILNYLRDKRTESMVLSRWARHELEAIEQTDCVNRDLFAVILQEAIEILPDKCRETYRLNKENKMSYKAIAELQGVSIKTVENQLRTASKRLQEYIKKSFSKTFLFFL